VPDGLLWAMAIAEATLEHLMLDQMCKGDCVEGQLEGLGAVCARGLPTVQCPKKRALHVRLALGISRPHFGLRMRNCM
jgi:hypothetical protein